MAIVVHNIFLLIQILYPLDTWCLLRTCIGLSACCHSLNVVCCGRFVWYCIVLTAFGWRGFKIMYVNDCVTVCCADLVCSYLLTSIT